MELLLAFSVVLFAGVLLGDGVSGVLELKPDDDLVIGLAELALFSVLSPTGCASASTTCAERGGSPDGP